MIEITPSLQIDERELQIDFVRSSGPGGQNVNKVATAAQLRFDVLASSLPEEIKSRLTQLAGNRITNEGVLLIEAKRFRTQERKSGRRHTAVCGTRAEITGQTEGT
jgi:ribosome-associated protein